MDVRERILEAAAAIYGTSGFRGTTTRRVAAEAGVNEVTLFRHFGSKEALLREVIAMGWQKLELLPLPDHTDHAAEEILTWALAYYSHHNDCAAFIRTRLGEFQEHPEIIPSAGSPPARTAAMLAAYLTRLQQAGKVRADVDPRRAAAMLIGTLFADAVTREGLREMFGAHPDDDIRGYVRIFLRGIGVTA
jgi:AcrR family transcriptional regulator